MTAKPAELTSKPPLIIDAAHSMRLEDLALGAMQRMPAVARQLLEEIERADVRPTAELPTHVVTIGSLVTYRDDTGAEHTMRLVFPENANIGEQRVSVLTPIGAALIGLSVGQTIAFHGPDGKVRDLTVLRVE